MQYYLHEGSEICCIHGGRVNLIGKGDPAYHICGHPILTETSIREAPIVGCTQPTTTNTKTCTLLKLVLSGQSTRNLVNGSPALLDTMIALTDGSKSGVFDTTRKPNPKNDLHGEAPGQLPEPSYGALAPVEKTWIEIALIDAADEPVPGVRYLVELTDGTTREGVLGSRGRKKWTGIDPGTCRVSFPGFDPEGRKVEQGAKDSKIEFNFRTPWGDPIEDPTGCELVYPDGERYPVTLVDGALERQGVPDGEYELRFRYIERASWSKDAARAGEDILLRVDTAGFEDGTKVRFEIFERFQSRNTSAVFEVEEEIAGDRAETPWRYEQSPGGAAKAEFVFETQIGHKRAVSSPLLLAAYPKDSLKGVQQRLKELGFDCGRTDGVNGPKTEAAVRKFQEETPPLEIDGIAGPLTRRELFQY